MIVFVGDLRLSDRSRIGQSRAAAFWRFSEQLAELAAAASLRTDGRYRPVEAIDLVLLGDVLDLIGSHDWLAADARPWHDPHTPDVFRRVARITERIIERNGATVAVLRELASGAAIGVPATVEAVEDPDAGSVGHGEVARVAVPVRIHYMVGDRDWFLHLPGPRYDRLRSFVAERLGLANPVDWPFPHDPAESGPLLEALRRHRVVARHGDIFDPLHFEEHRDAASLGDALAIELIGRFRLEIRGRFADRLPAAALHELAELENAGPLLLAPVWIEHALDRACASLFLHRDVKLLWDRLVERFLELDFVRSRESWNPVDLVDGLADVLQFGRQSSARRRQAAAAWIDALSSHVECASPRYALDEEAFRGNAGRYVVHGHTRQIATAPCESISFLTFYQGDERSGRSYDTSPENLALPNSPSRFAA